MPFFALVNSERDLWLRVLQIIFCTQGKGLKIFETCVLVIEKFNLTRNINIQEKSKRDEQICDAIKDLSVKAECWGNNF